MAKVNSGKNKLMEEVQHLSSDRIKVLADFAAYLRKREEWEETTEILGDKKTARRLKRSRKAWAEGKEKEFVPLDELKARLAV